MKAVIQILKEQVNNTHLIMRMASYDIKSQYQSHYLGVAWQFLNPAFQILVYWFVFGIGIRQGHPINGVPYFIWLLIGLIPWFFINPAIIQGSNSIFTKVNMVSKMKFPVSVLPSINIISNGFNFIFMLVVLALILFLYGINPGVYLLQLPYYLLCTFVFLFAVTLLFSTISTIIRDFQLLLQSVMRMMMYIIPVLWDMENLPSAFMKWLKLNPLYYIIAGYRDTFLDKAWFFHDWVYMLYFWITTLMLLFIGSVIHLRFRKQFVDYL